MSLHHPGLGSYKLLPSQRCCSCSCGEPLRSPPLTKCFNTVGPPNVRGKSKNVVLLTLQLPSYGKNHVLVIVRASAIIRNPPRTRFRQIVGVYRSSVPGPSSSIDLLCHHTFCHYNLSYFIAMHVRRPHTGFICLPLHRTVDSLRRYPASSVDECL